MASSLSLAGSLLLRVRLRLYPQVRLRARDVSTSASSATSPKLLGFRGLAAIGLASGTVWGASVFIRDARAGAAATASRPDAQAQSANTLAERRAGRPLSELVRTYVVFSFCSIPALVDWAPTILATLFAVPGVRQVAEGVVRATFFSQFVGGESAEDALPLIEGLRAQNTGCLFAYSVEVDEAEASGRAMGEGAEKNAAFHKHVVHETLHCIDVAADFEDQHAKGHTGRRTWVAIKLSAMVQDAETLRRFSKYLVDHRPPSSPPVAFPGCPLPTDLEVLSAPGLATVTDQLSDADVAALRELRDDLVTICERAKKRGIRLIFDAEYSWYEPAIDALTLDMMRRFNRLPEQLRKPWFGGPSKMQEDVGVQPLVYATYQAYFRRTPEYLAQSIAAARKEGYALGIKLVRGAYHPHELVAHPATTATADASLASPSTSTSLSISPEPVPPVWTEKAETDARYDACVRMLIGEVRRDVERGGKDGVPTIGVLFGTHNWRSAGLILEELARQGLAEIDEGGAVSVRDEVAERVTMGQLYGMSVALTSYLVGRVRSSSPFVIKYIPYGHLSEVMPYLSRRAIENKSVLGNGGAEDERKRAAAEIWAKVFG